MHEVRWQEAVPQYEEFATFFEQYAQIEPTPYSHVQRRYLDAIKWLTAPSCRLRCLTVMAPDIRKYLEETKLAVESLSSSGPVIVSDCFNEASLFGAYYAQPDSVTASHKVKGLIEEADGGVLVLPLAIILSQISLWPRLKSFLTSGIVADKAIKPDLIIESASRKLDTKVILVGDRQLLADFHSVEPELFDGVSLYGEIEQDFALTAESVSIYLGWIKHAQVSTGVRPLNTSAVKRLLQAGARGTEDQHRMPLDPVWLEQILVEANSLCDSQQLGASDIEMALERKALRASYLPERAIEDIHKGHVFIDTRGEHIGQVNGLTVIELPGHPLSYGEPARISCVVHFGDGDISDVERKAELAGNIHAKGMMIMQAFVSAALDLEEPLPYSASIVFEQSYCEVDGDSASLAELCAFVSALAQQPINQSVAVTGAVDQFGRVQAVGGINEKIEGYYQVCAHRGLTGQQGVVLPKTNLSALCLNSEVTQAIREGKFHIWAVEDVEEAFPLITGKSFSGDDDDTLLNRIAKRIDTFHNGENRNSGNMLSRFTNWFVQN